MRGQGELTTRDQLGELAAALHQDPVVLQVPKQLRGPTDHAIAILHLVGETQIHLSELTTERWLLEFGDAREPFKADRPYQRSAVSGQRSAVSMYKAGMVATNLPSPLYTFRGSAQA